MRLPTGERKAGQDEMNQERQNAITPEANEASRRVFTIRRGHSLLQPPALQFP